MERQFPRSRLAAEQGLPAPASPRGNHSSSSCCAAARLDTAGAQHGHPAGQQQASVQKGMLRAKPAGEHVSKAHGITGVPAMQDCRHSCCKGLLPDVCVCLCDFSTTTYCCLSPAIGTAQEKSALLTALLQPCYDLPPKPLSWLHRSKFLKGIV